ncbi:DUF397 domain-containing protein [Streptomonospora nanhaiensis]|uniref:DUF397 domain-containing protein n=1 Tax=Streptomonospora nanhaiensis TaxID=1323731 RepID=A0A853BNY9_9ACTN|nr:DUF397 domain-containing protein [Streptomonospora nanhaiensis]MBV2362189.1 DUF397 domain-containing protein [Streptomonospora nanhaiensis]MBX9388163.1 DUF397 domain-containing protein [Streptomonospora nanhaiensis]NYI97359.1 hypothetical protein [Streptomonospora nanhaiensis]
MINGHWTKSSYSSGGTNCVETRLADDAASALVRDTQNRDKGALAFPVTEWAAFLAEVDTL